MKPTIPFSYVSSRKLSLQSNVPAHKTSALIVSNNLNTKNLLLYIESTDEDMDSRFIQALDFYGKLSSEKDLTEYEKRRIENSLLANLPKTVNLNKILDGIIGDDTIENKQMFINTIENLEESDRVLRNEQRLLKRFDLNKTIRDNIDYGDKHTVFELCSLIDTYDMSPKAKLNIALENVSYALFKSGVDIDLNEVAEHVVDYFLTREAVIPDKVYKGYISVLKNNRFINNDNENFKYVFEAAEEDGNLYLKKAEQLVVQCETKPCAAHMSKLVFIKNEKEASEYIDDSIRMILYDEDMTLNDSILLFKSIYSLPLIGNISKEFVDYKIETSGKTLDIKKKLTGIDDEKLVRDVMDEGTLMDCATLISRTTHFENYILDDAYTGERNIFKILEAGTDDIKDIIDSFKASNEKSTSKFRNMINRIMTKSPENIIDETPNIFAAVRIMLYLGVAATGPLGTVFAAILALIGKLVSTHMDIKQAEKLLKHLKSEKDKAKKKLDKLSGKDKQTQEEYISCIDKCIKKVEDFIMNIDDENEELNNTDDDFDFDDFDLDDINFESAVLETGLVSVVGSGFVTDLMDMLSQPVNEDILSNIAVLVDNCPSKVANEFYNLLDKLSEDNKGTSYGLCCESLVQNRGASKIAYENSFIVQYEAMDSLKKVVKDAKGKVDKTVKDVKGKFTKKEDIKTKKKPTINLNTLKMAVVNFKKKFRELKGKEQELWRNIDISTNQLTNGIQKALTSDRREAIIKGSIIPSFSKCIKFAISVGAIGAFAGPVNAAIAAVGMLGASAALNERERRLLYDEIDTELQVVDKQIQLAESEGNMNQYRFLLNYQKKLKREKYRIKYGVRMQGRTIPELKGGKD